MHGFENPRGSKIRDCDARPSIIIKNQFDARRRRGCRFAVSRISIANAKISAKYPATQANPEASKLLTATSRKSAMTSAAVTIRSHPRTCSRPVFSTPSANSPKERLVDHGMSLDEFAKTTHKALKPGGVFVIYNICPAPSKTNEPYKHWAGPDR